MLIIEALRKRSLAFALASAWALVPAVAANDPGLRASEGGPDLLAPGNHEVFDQAAGWQVLSTAKLDRVRGGFDLPDLQLKLSFGFDQAVFVNGELVARTVLTMEQLRSSVASEIEAIRSQMNPAAMSAEIQSQVAQQLAAAGIQATVALPTEVAPAPVVANQTPVTSSPASGASTPAPVPAATTPPALTTPVAAATPPIASSTTQAPNSGTAVASSPVAVAGPVTVASPPVVTTQPAASTGLASTVPAVGVSVPVSSSPATAPVAQGTVGQSAPPLPPASTGVLQPAPIVAASPPAAVSAAAPAVAPASPPATNPVASTAVGAVAPTPATPAASVAAGNGQTLVPSVATAPASTKAVPAAQQPASTTVTSSQSGSVTTVVNNSSFTPVLVIQNGGGNTVGSSAASSAANAPISTVVQNSLDDQRIQVLTEISASANSIEIMRAMNLGSSIREGLINSLRR